MDNGIKGVIFDLDGVLTCTADYHYVAWKRVADELGVYFDRTINERLKGIDRIASLEIMLERSENHYTPEEKMKIAGRKNGYYLELIGKITPKDLYPGVLELLERIKAGGIKTALGSASRNAFEITAKLGIKDYFDAIVDANRINRGKPDPEIFITAAEMMGLKCSDCAVVEDSTAGIKAAKAAGMTAVAIGRPEQFPGADLVYSETGELDLDDIDRNK